MSTMNVQPQIIYIYTRSPEVIEYQKEYRKAHLKKYAKHSSNYYDANKVKCKARMKEYYEKKKAEKAALNTL
jgi:hypothetical protein